MVFNVMYTIWEGAKKNNLIGANWMPIGSKFSCLLFAHMVPFIDFVKWKNSCIMALTVAYQGMLDDSLAF